MPTRFSRTFIKKTKSMRPPPLMFSWDIYKFFKIAEAATKGKKDHFFFYNNVPHKVQTILTYSENEKLQ